MRLLACGETKDDDRTDSDNSDSSVETDEDDSTDSDSDSKLDETTNKLTSNELPASAFPYQRTCCMVPITRRNIHLIDPTSP